MKRQTPRIDWPSLWKKFDTWSDRHWFEWEEQQKKIVELVETQVAKLIKGGKTPLCFSCEKKPPHYADGLCEACHRVAVAESRVSGFTYEGHNIPAPASPAREPCVVWVVECIDDNTPTDRWGPIGYAHQDRKAARLSARDYRKNSASGYRCRVAKYVRSEP